jgi:quercetin dioxygenase-like cupin family protein
MIIRNTPQQAKKINARVDGRLMHTDPRFEAILLTLAPGETMADHPNPLDVLFIGISGKGKLTQGQDRYGMAPGTSIFVSTNELRGWENPYDEPCRVMVLKMY